jgi:hypothetical protein
LALGKSSHALAGKYGRHRNVIYSQLAAERGHEPTAWGRIGVGGFLVVIAPLIFSVFWFAVIAVCALSRRGLRTQPTNPVAWYG